MRGMSGKRKTAFYGMFLSLALICSYVESLIPFYFGVPGMKLGLANLVVVIMLYLAGPNEAFLISVLRILLAGFLFGNLFGILYSLGGGCLSFAAMLLLQKSKKFSVVSVSVLGGICHNIGQLSVASLTVENYHVFYYAPALLLAGFVTGFLIGALAKEVICRMPE